MNIRSNHVVFDFQRPPFSIELFSPDQVKLITEYTINTYFRHFKMYKYAFTPQVKLDLGITYEGIPVPSPPPEGQYHKLCSTHIDVKCSYNYGNIECVIIARGGEESVMSVMSLSCCRHSCDLRGAGRARMT